MNFRFCPHCGAESTAQDNVQSLSKFHCEHCNYELYANVAATASLILLCGDELLFSVRAKEPSKGLLDFPGGFVDPGESVEEAFVREMEEELGWVPEQFQYAFSLPNIYLYQGVEYHTADLFYFAEVQEKPALQALDDVGDLRWLTLAEVKVEQLAFHSMKLAVEQLSGIFNVE